MVALVAHFKSRPFYLFCLILLICHYAGHHSACKLQKRSFLLRFQSTNHAFFPRHRNHHTAWEIPITLRGWYLICLLHHLLPFSLRIDLRPAFIIIPSGAYYSITLHSKFPFHACPIHACICICRQRKPQLTLTNKFLNS